MTRQPLRAVDGCEAADLSSGHGLAATLRFHLSLCLPSKAVRPPSGPLWVHEIKHDGYRLMVRWDGLRVRRFTAWVGMAAAEALDLNADNKADKAKIIGMLKVSLSAASLGRGRGL